MGLAPGRWRLSLTTSSSSFCPLACYLSSSPSFLPSPSLFTTKPSDADPSTHRTPVHPMRAETGTVIMLFLRPGTGPVKYWASCVGFSLQPQKVGSTLIPPLDKPWN